MEPMKLFPDGIACPTEGCKWDACYRLVWLDSQGDYHDPFAKEVSNLVRSESATVATGGSVAIYFCPECEGYFNELNADYG